LNPFLRSCDLPESPFILKEHHELMINPTLLETPAAELPAIHDAGTPRRSTALLVLCGLWLSIFFAALFSPPLLDDADATPLSTHVVVRVTRYFLPEVLRSLFRCAALYSFLRSLDHSNSSAYFRNWEKKESVIVSEGGALVAEVEGPAVKFPAAQSLSDKPR